VRYALVALIAGLLAGDAMIAAAQPGIAFGLPPLVAPPDNPLTPERIALGRRLFFDARLSADGKISCASCHQPDKAFSDGKRVAEGLDGRRGARNTPSLLNAAFANSQFWDGRRNSLEEQALDPLLNPAEHGLANEAQLLAILNADQAYRQAFAAAFDNSGNAITATRVSMAIASFVRTLVAADTPFDRYHFGGDKSAMTPSAINGLQVFRGRAQCATCHLIEERHALFTDHQFHTLAVGFDRVNSQLPQLIERTTRRRGTLDDAIFSDPELAELGRFLVTGKPADIGKFKTPSLRNVALTPPYMHDGSVPTLQAAVEREIYYRGLEANRPLVLTMQQKEDLVEFLKALTSDKLPQ